MTWLFIAVALVAMGMALWLKRMAAHHERAFTDQEERLKQGDRNTASGSENSSHLSSGKVGDDSRPGAVGPACRARVTPHHPMA